MVQTMNYLNLQQSIDYLKERLAISYFDLPQLAHLCSEKKLIPYFHFVGLMAKTDNPPYFIEYFNGYLTSIELLKILANPHQWETLSLHHALRYTENHYQDKNDPFTWDWAGLSVDSEMLEHENFGEYAYSCSGFIKYEKGYPLSLQDICFDLEQLESIAPIKKTAPTDPQSDTPADMVKIPHQSYRTIDRILYALIQLSGADNSEPYSQNNPSLNAKITTILQNDGLPLEYEAVGKWLARANDLKPINKK